MAGFWRRLRWRAKLKLATAGDYAVYLVGAGALDLIGAIPLDTASALGGAVMRRLGPLLPVHRIAAENLRLAMPELDAAARRRILRGSWENLGRMACEFAHMDQIAREAPETPGQITRIELPQQVIDAFLHMRDDGQPALVFSVHMANWELPAVLASHYDMPSAALYRTPNNRYMARRIRRMRGHLMGRLIGAGRNAPLELVAALRDGAHVGMLVDQRFGRGVRIPFFGRPAATNTIFAKIARHVDCPIYGVRAVRKEGANFRMELVGPLSLPRDAEGLIDIEAATVAVTRIIEGWIRATPEQWLWMHRRWRL